MTTAKRELFPPQRNLLASGFLESSDDWVICMPTGAGKTLLGELAMEKSTAEGLVAAYIAPLKAILEEKFSEWKSRYPDLTIGLFTGDTRPRERACNPTQENLLLFTPEKLGSYVQRWKRNLSWLSRIGVLVVDEAHMIGDRTRGAGLEALLGRIRRINPHCRIISLTATLSNADEVARWLKARVFTSDWRPIPIDKRIVRFKKANEKITLLIDEIRTTLDSGGKVLVFVNSRRRSEQIAQALQAEGISADFNHAGLSQDRRTSTQKALREGAIDVVVATSTLEMGVNFPARKVVVFDSYGFDGDSFVPLPVHRFLQCAGRAGRPGYDTHGDAVLFLPTWATDRTDYLGGIPEPLRSGFFSRDSRALEMLVEVSSRLSISEEHLEGNFLGRSLWRRQGGGHDTKEEVDFLLASGLIKRMGDNDRFLSDTALGRIAVQSCLSPQTVSLFQSVHSLGGHLSHFDFLLAACLAGEVTPRLGFNFEEIDHMADLLLSVPSHLLDMSVVDLRNLTRVTAEKTLLSAVKNAVILLQHTDLESLESLAERYDVYPNDLIQLKKNTTWVLEAAQRIFSVSQKLEAEIDFIDVDRDGKDVSGPPSLGDLRFMVSHGVPLGSVSLARIKGIGHRRARMLIDAGITDIQGFLGTEPAALAGLLRVRTITVSSMRESALQMVNECPSSGRGILPAPHRPAPHESTAQYASPREIDPYRLRRALELRVDHTSREAVRVSGGAEPHTVHITVDRIGPARYACDCQDFAKGHPHCKHIIRARLELHDDDEILALLRNLRGDVKRSVRYSLGELWMKIGGAYDSFNGRSVDYHGQVFLDRAATRNRWQR